MLYRKFQKLRGCEAGEEFVVVGTPHDHLVHGKNTEIYALRNSQGITVIVNRELVESDHFQPMPD